MNITKTVLIGSVFATTALTAQVQAAQQTAPAFIKKISDGLINRLEADQAKYAKNPKHLQTIVNQQIEPYIDFAGFSRGVMGKYYRRATPAQKAEFQKTFRHSLLTAYSQYLGKYDNQTYKIKPFKAGKDPKKAVVSMDLKMGSGEVIPISYQLVDNGKAWKIRNVKAAGIDIGLTFRKQFQTAMGQNKNNMDKAIKNFLPKAKKP